MPKVLVPLAEGCEELEAVTVIDLLRRAGIEVVTAGLDGDPVLASRGVRLIPDIDLDRALEQQYDMIVVPGGAGGADRLNADPRIRRALRGNVDNGRYVAAICAGPKVLASEGLLAGRRATGFPGVLEAMELDGTTLVEEPVVVDGEVITSRGPGTAMDFALELIARLSGTETRARVEAALQRPPGQRSA